jgi:hypothetical protein
MSPPALGNPSGVALKDILFCGLHLMASARSTDYSHQVKTKKHILGITRFGSVSGAALVAALAGGVNSAVGHGIGTTLTLPTVVQDDYVQYRIYFLLLILGIGLLTSGVVMLKRLPDHQRRVWSGEIQPGKSQHSFKARRRTGIGLLIGGMLIVVVCAHGIF